MRALILAAGYATRLYPLTRDRPKPLLDVGGRALVDWILDRIAEVSEIEEVHLVTNAKFAPAFRAWAPPHVVVHDDGTRDEEDRLGAIGDLAFVGLGGDDLLVVAGDNLFDFSLRELVAFWRAKGRASAVALYDVGDVELARKYGIVELDEQARIVSFLEKPDDPPSTLAATATYLFHREHLALVPRYLEEGNSPDQPGRFVAWLQAREPVYGYRLEGEWLDIGDHDQLRHADAVARSWQSRRKSGTKEPSRGR
ncbi:MAG TPA: nucleotidyltransferase family protein [Gaiellaceae bacterium]|jgi:glucose-1-phosphate thymidylyltransferase|nr:nucleotidyltransferase family protein [Gaiellaceae bacterium]